MLTTETVKTLKRGTRLYNNILGPTYVAVVTGKPTYCKANGWIVPVRRDYGDGGGGHITQNGYRLWRVEIEPSEEDMAVLRDLNKDSPRPRTPYRPTPKKEPVVVKMEPIRIRRTRINLKNENVYMAEFEGQEIPVIKL